MSVDVSSLYNGYVNNAIESAAATRTEQSFNRDLNNSTDEELMSACKQFESYFVEMMFKEMLKTVNVDSEMSAPTKNLMNYFKDNLTQEYAKSATDTSDFGLAQMLYEQMKRTNG